MRAGRPRRSGLRRWVTVALLGLLVAGCAGELPQSALAPAGPVARRQDALWDLVFPIAVAVFVLVQGLILVAVFRFRSRGGDQPLPAQVHGNTRLEILWTIIPAAILAGVAVPTVATIWALADEPEGALQVHVTGKQYFWEFRYIGDPEDDTDDVYTANELHIPVDVPVYLTMEAPGLQNDANGVLHSFWVPRLAGKQDVVPGHVRNLTIQADEAGTYPGQCAEFCGLSHSRMRFYVIAEEQEDFERWLAEQAEPAEPASGDLVAEGERLFTDATCIACHAIEGYEGAEARVGPNLTHFASREWFAGAIFPVEEEAVKAWLANPPEVKPGAQMPNLNLSSDEIDALTAYLLSLD